jgi:hypothetical protein
MEYVMAESSVVNFRTPQEFIEYYSTQMKLELSVYDLQVNKLGFIGFFLNLLGYTNYDAKQYYDSLFKESFIATSQETENLYFHSATYGYLPTFATPSNAFGDVIFDFALLPKMPAGVVKREAIIGADEVINFEQDGYNFISESKYKFIESVDGYSSIVTTKEGRVNQIPSANSEVHAPFQDFNQYKIEEFTLTLPNYSFGTYYPYVVEIDDGHISDITVSIKTKNSSTEEEYQVKYVKYFEESFSKTVFLRKLTSKKFVVEFGSGVRGAYIPSATVNISVKITKGEQGNISKESYIGPKNYVVIVNYYSAAYNNKIKTLAAQSAQKFIKMHFQYSKDGENPLTGDELRNQIVSHIQSYDMLVSERDFYNIAQKYINDFKFLFKKTNVQENIFYLCRSFRDKYQLVCPTTNLTIPEIDNTLFTTNETSSILDVGEVEAGNITYNILPSDGFNNAVETVIVVDAISRESLISGDYSFVFESNEVLCSNQTDYDNINVSDWIYPQDNFDNRLQVLSKDDTDGYKLILSGLYQGIDSTGDLVVYSPTSIQLDWDAVPGAVKYKIFKSYDNIDYQCINVYTNQVIDDGTNFVDCSYYTSQELVFNPIFDIAGKTMISPFLYKFNSFMGWYDGYLLYDSLIVHFSETKNTGLSNYDIPVLYFFIRYDINQAKTIIELKSHQDISQYQFSITISEKSIYNQLLTNINTTTFRYEYDVDDGLFWEEFQIQLFATTTYDHSFEGMTNSIYQVNDIKDQLVVHKHKEFVYVGETIDSINNFIINIPLIGYDEFIDDEEFYQNKIKQYIIDNDIPGNRMVSDDLQFRFLDTIQVSSYYLENFTTQKYNSFEIKFPLNLSIEILVDSDLVIKRKINLAEKTSDFNLMVADWLQKNHTGTSIAFYNSQVVDLIHTDQEWIKQVVVELTDSVGTVIPNGIETLSDRQGLKNIKDDKLGIIKYTSWFWHWNVDNIDIKMTL